MKALQASRRLDDMGAGERPIAILRESTRRDGRGGSSRHGSRRVSATPSPSQLLRVCVLLAVGLACAAWLRAGSAKAEQSGTEEMDEGRQALRQMVNINR
jgi:hypothetical protein